VTFMDSTNNPITIRTQSFTIEPQTTQTLTIKYDYSCTQQPLPEKYTTQLTIPKINKCEQITKTRTIQVETCKDKIYYTPNCQ